MIDFNEEDGDASTRSIEVAAVGLTALGGGVGIVLAFSNWLGKVWADADHDE